MIDRSNVRTHTCSACGEGAATLGILAHEFVYGSGDAATTLHADVPVWTCDACEMQYLDAEGEAMQHAAICRHLGRLTPDEVRSARVELGLKQADFAERLLCGIASVKRWETGAVIQNAAVDAQIRELAAAAAKAKVQPTFRNMFSPEQLRRAMQFQLRPTLSMAA